MKYENYKDENAGMHKCELCKKNADVKIDGKYYCEEHGRIILSE